MQRSRVQRQRQRKNELQALVSKYKYVLIVLAVIALYVIYQVISAFVAIGVGPAKFYRGVHINGIPLEGYSLEEGSAYMRSAEASWLSTAYTLTYEDKSWTFTPADIQADLDMDTLLARAWNIGHVGSIFSRKSSVLAAQKNPVNLISDIRYDETLMNAFVQQIQSEVDIAPVDASIICDIDQPRILTESSDGRSLDVEATKEQMYALMLGTSSDTALKVDVVKPAISSDDANGGLQIIAQCRTDTSTSTSKRLTNVKRALDYFNALTVHNGEQVSFNAIVGERTEAHGFVPAPEFSEGEVTEGIGGGVCQASTTLYGALLVSGMDIVERHPHSMTVGYTKPSFDAAVTNRSKNLVFENNSGNPIYIYTQVTKEAATVTIYGVRPQYRIDLESVILVEDIEPTATRLEVDESGEHVYYKDETKLKSEGKKGKKSECWRICYNWATGEEISRTKISTYTYEPGTTVYYIGAHDRT